MGNVIISLLIIFSIIIQKFETNVTNKKIIYKVQRFHDSVKKHFQKISDSPINNESKKIVSNWLLGLFFLLAVINYVSALIFGNNSENTLLNNHKILYSIIPFILVLSGYLSNKWHILFLIILTIISGVIFFNSAYNPHINKTNDLNKFMFVILMLISIFLIVITFIIYHFLLKWLAILFHFLLKKYFKFCLYLNPEKPLKPFLVIVDIFFILLIPIFNLF